MTSVVIAAHDEEGVLGQCLDTLIGDRTDSSPGSGALDITVVANGCRDRTAQVARSRDRVRVIDLPASGKTGALNAGDAVAVGFPRLYLDADINLSAADVALLAGALRGAVLASAPRRVLNTAGCPWPVRCYFAVSARLPVFVDSLFGRGAVMLSEQARSRFERFPSLIADDLFLDALFEADEKREVPSVVSVVSTPRTTPALVQRLIRVRAGNSELRSSQGAKTGGVRPSDRWAWLRVVGQNPYLAPASLVYIALTGYAEVRSRLTSGNVAWGQDESTRTAAPEQTL